jgi:predicted helicase
MACGTGKTFTALKIAQDMVGVGNMALYLVPSLSLLNQTIRAWTIDASIPIRAFAVCSDSQVGKHRKFSDENDVAEIEAHDLDYPATTDATKLGQKASVSAPDRMTVIFSTYQSIDVISQAQKEYGLPAFKLIICDEAHRTTGATLENQEHSDFLNLLTTKVASNCLESQVARWQFCK